MGGLEAPTGIFTFIVGMGLLLMVLGLIDVFVGTCRKDKDFQHFGLKVAISGFVILSVSILFFLPR
jgi:hypothetical protein